MADWSIDMVLEILQYEKDAIVQLSRSNAVYIQTQAVFDYCFFNFI